MIVCYQYKKIVSDNRPTEVEWFTDRQACGEVMCGMYLYEQLVVTHIPICVWKVKNKTYMISTEKLIPENKDQLIEKYRLANN